MTSRDLIWRIQAAVPANSTLIASAGVCIPCKSQLYRFHMPTYKPNTLQWMLSHYPKMSCVTVSVPRTVTFICDCMWRSTYFCCRTLSQTCKVFCQINIYIYIKDGYWVNWYVFLLQRSQSLSFSNRWRYWLHGFDMYILSSGRFFFIFKRAFWVMYNMK